MKLAITMLGNSKAGKTCYLYAMANMMARPQNGFTFIPESHRDSLMLLKEWRDMQHQEENGKIVKRGERPIGTVESCDINFHLMWNSKLLATFTWHDYRGGLLETVSDEAQWNALEDKINSSSCIIVCIAAEVLQGYLKNDLDSEGILTNYAQIIQRYKIKSGKTVPIVFNILKADKLREGEFTAGIEKLKENIFSVFFHREVGNGWALMFVGSSLGTFDETEEQFNPETKRGYVFGKFAPVNVQLSVFFAIRCGLISKLKTASDKVNELNRRYDSKSSELDRELARSRWSKFWKGSNEGSIRWSLKDIRSDLELENDEVAKLKSDLALIDKGLFDNEPDAVQVYFNGEKIEV